MHTLTVTEVKNISAGRLGDYFRDIRFNKFFQPHPFTKEYAANLVKYSGSNLYYVLLVDDRLCGYGFIRGWDEGWEDKCVGLIIWPFRGWGLGKVLMDAMHVAARLRGLDKIRLHVHPANEKALCLYKSLDYKFVGTRENGELIGYKDL